MGSKYRLERPLAAGGMGSLWVARHVHLREPVAVKFMSASLASSSEAQQRFEREATAVAQLQRRTRHVVQIHDYGFDEGVPYLTMELLEGENLHQRLKRERRLPLPTVASLLVQLAKALRPAHEVGIIHRDIKPSNIFLARSDDEEVLKVLDFGLAKGEALHVKGESTRTGDVVGSPHYMSPEQSRGRREVDWRTDLFSAAVVVYRATVGQLPFRGSQLGDVIVKICTEAPPRASHLLPGAPAGLDAFFERALHKDPERRYQSAKELAEAFASLVGREPSFSSLNLPGPRAPLDSASELMPLVPQPVAGLAPPHSAATAAAEDEATTVAADSGGQPALTPGPYAGQEAEHSSPSLVGGTLTRAATVTGSGMPRERRRAVLALAGIGALTVAGLAVAIGLAVGGDEAADLSPEVAADSLPTESAPLLSSAPEQPEPSAEPPTEPAASSSGAAAAETAPSAATDAPETTASAKPQGEPERSSKPSKPRGHDRGSQGRGSRAREVFGL